MNMNIDWDDDTLDSLDEPGIMRLSIAEALGETCDTAWVGDTLVLAVVKDGRTHIEIFNRGQLLDWYARAVRHWKNNPYQEFEACVAATFCSAPLVLEAV